MKVPIFVDEHPRVSTFNSVLIVSVRILVISFCVKFR